MWCEREPDHVRQSTTTLRFHSWNWKLPRPIHAGRDPFSYNKTTAVVSGIQSVRELWTSRSLFSHFSPSVLILVLHPLQVTIITRAPTTLEGNLKKSSALGDGGGTKENSNLNTIKPHRLLALCISKIISFGGASSASSAGRSCDCEPL